MASTSRHETSILLFPKFLQSGKTAGKPICCVLAKEKKEDKKRGKNPRNEAFETKDIDETFVYVEMLNKYDHSIDGEKLESIPLLYMPTETEKSD